MTLRQPLRSLAALFVLAACAALTVNALRPITAGPAEKPRKAAVPRVEPAANPTRLLLHDDGRQIVGWISGTADRAGQTVTVAVTGEKEQARQVKLDKGNAFAWPYTVAKPTTVRFTARIPVSESKTTLLQDSLTVAPAPAEEGPSVFFVVDRTAYRPTQTLHFAGFLRKMDGKGEFTPLARQEVEIELISEKKQTRVFKLKTLSDDFGRITGQYTFQHDALDNYILSVAGFKGSARVMLGEYRKSKIKLAIKGEVKEEKLKLTFEVLDFLANRVEGARASFHAQVVRRDGKAKATTLKSDDFVYHTPLINSLAGWDSLGEDAQLLWQAEGPGAAAFLSSGGSVVVAQLDGEVNMKGDRAGEYTIDLKKEWLGGNHSILVSGVATDANGREQRASRSIPIGEAKCPGVTLELADAAVVVGDKILVQAKRGGKEAGDHAYDGPLTLVVMKLSPGAPTAAYNPYGSIYGGYNYGYRAYRYGRYRYWNDAPAVETVKRKMVTAAPFNKKDVAMVKLTESGAYKLVAIGQREDGTTVRTEVGCVVRAPANVPGLTLQLDSDEFTVGAPLLGRIRSKYAGARVLLTVRDSTGLRLWKPLTLDKEGTLALKESLPADLRYGCTVEVQYVMEGGKLVGAEKFVHILPTDRMLTITPTVKPTVGPGETVKIDLQVNRSEEVDLVVSVYDQSLLGIAPDKFVDVKNFYLADERGRAEYARDALRRRLGNATLEAMAKKADSLLAANKNLAQTVEGQQLQQLVNAVRNRVIRAIDVATAMRLAGLEVMLHPGPTYYYGLWYFQHSDPTGKEHRLADLLGHKYNTWTLAHHLVNNSVLLYETHPSYAGQLLTFNIFNLYYANSYGYRGYGLNQVQMMNGVAQGGLASANSSFSASGQSFVSHLPMGGARAGLINTDSDQAHIGVRRDFSDSAFWNATVRTDRTGKASVTFKLPDSLTNWQVVVTGVSKKMHVGQAKASFRSFKPIMVWPMLPRVFTEGDRVELFGSVHNQSDRPQAIKVKLKVENGEILTAPEKVVEVPAGGNVPVYWTFKALKPGFTQLLMTADCPAGNDASLKRLPVGRSAAEQIVTASGVVKDEATIRIPAGVDLKASSLEVSFAPSLAADMADTLNYLVEYPYGCVEQTMSRFLPAIKVSQVLADFHIDHPELKKKLPGCVLGGIKRLLELQLADGGWGWHGNGMTHEMMTPYALYGLLQAEKAGYAIPGGNAVDRGLVRLKMFIDAMKENQTADRIYCMHVYAHRRDLEPAWWDFIAKQLAADKLSDQALALALETAVQKGKKNLAGDLAKALRDRVKKVRGHCFWETAGFSRWGDDKFEVTAAAMKALVSYDKDDPLIEGILAFFAATKRGDRWNSTKDTAMILYAMCDYLAKQKFDPKAKPELSFALNSGENRKVAFDKHLTQKFVLPGGSLREGVNKLSFQTTATGMMYRVVFRYWKTGADIKPMDEGVTVSRKFYLLDGKGGWTRQLQNGDKVPRGSYVLSDVIASDRLKSDMRYVLVENPKPACAEILPVEDARFAYIQPSTPYALREERADKVVFHHEQTPWQLNDRCVLLMELAGEYVVPPAHVEMMYRTEHRGHSGTFTLKVVDEKK